MTETRDKLLSNAGGLLLAAGGLAAFTGGSYGLAQTRPGFVVLSVLLLMGYGVVGYLLMNRLERSLRFVLPATSILVLATLFLFQASAGILDDDTGSFLLHPLLTLLLAFAGGALLTHLLEMRVDRVRWPGKGARSLNTLLHVAAYAPVWNAFTLLSLLPTASPAFRLLIVSASVAASLAAVVGGYAASRSGHPAITLAGSAAAFLACVAYLFQFMLGGGSSDAVFFGQFNSLIGLILSGLPIAIATVAWIQLSTPTAADEAPADEAPADATL